MACADPEEKQMRANEVFTPTTEPVVTYVGNRLIEKTRQLKQSLETGGCGDCALRLVKVWQDSFHR
ncbi:hypothetical protein D5045_21425 [Verminephrobacter eiseniae]|nr:hypothetical protein [Verminephrobacter eiseniae]